MTSAVRSLFDLHHPFFRPLWRRVAVVAVCLVWAAYELATGSVFWGVIFGGIGLFAGWQSFVTFDPGQGSNPR